jgi:F-type H+-transporting ATPase subunit epsilon
MADDLLLDIVTPEKLIVSTRVEDVTIPGTEGEFGVLRGHASLLSSIEIGELSYTKDGKRTYYAVETGYAEILASKVTVLVESAEHANDIDKDWMMKRKEETEAKISKMSKEDPDYDKLRTALSLAELKLRVANKN